MDPTVENAASESEHRPLQVVTPIPSIPADDPFANDLLNNRARAEALTRLIGRARTPYVLSIDAEWGNGKTTFLNMLIQHLRNEGFGVVEFNAWENDFTDNPFTTLAGEIVKQTKSFGRASITERAVELAKTAAPIAIEVGVGTGPAIFTGNVPGLGANIVRAILKATRLLDQNDPISRYDATTRGVRRFKFALKATAKEMASQHEGKPMVVAIDEQDRCRPDYAIRFIEAIKHLFNTENIVFVVATNMDQTAHTVKAVYGQTFDAKEYLNRFFDLPVKLTHPDLEDFISHRTHDIVTHWIGLEEIPPEEGNFRQLPPSLQRMPEEMRTAGQLLIEYCRRSGISLRRIDKITNRIRLILDLLGYIHSTAVLTIAIVSIIRDADPATYERILDGSVTDQDIVRAMNNAAGQLEAPHWTHIAEGTAVGLAHVLPANNDRLSQAISGQQEQFPLTASLRSTNDSPDANQAAKRRAAQILEQARKIVQLQEQSQLPISEAIRSAELIVPAQTQNHTTMLADS